MRPDAPISSGIISPMCCNVERCESRFINGRQCPSLCVNVHLAYERGNQLISKLAGSNPLTVAIKKVDICTQMPIRAAIDITNTTTHPPIDPNFIFQRAFAQASNSEMPISMKECLAYELSPFPMSLFTEAGHIQQTRVRAGFICSIIQRGQP